MTTLNYTLRETTLEEVIDRAVIDTVGHLKSHTLLVRRVRDAIFEAELDGEYLAARGAVDTADPDTLIRYLEFNSAELERVKKRYQDDLADHRAKIDALEQELKEAKENQ